MVSAQELRRFLAGNGWTSLRLGRRVLDVCPTCRRLKSTDRTDTTE